MKKINKVSKYAVGAALGLSLLLPLLAMAAVVRDPAPIIAIGHGRGDPAPILPTPRSIVELVKGISNWLATLVLVVAVLMFFYAAILYMTAGASETALAKSKTVLIYAVIGVAVALLAYSFIPLIEAFLRLTG